MGAGTPGASWGADLAFRAAGRAPGRTAGRQPGLSAVILSLFRLATILSKLFLFKEI